MRIRYHFMKSKTVVGITETLGVNELYHSREFSDDCASELSENCKKSELLYQLSGGDLDAEKHDPARLHPDTTLQNLSKGRLERYVSTAFPTTIGLVSSV